MAVPGLGVTQTYTTQAITVTLTTLPVDARGAYNKSFQITGTFSSVTNVAIEASIHPFIIVTPTINNGWYVIGNLSTPTWFLIHSGEVRAFRARTVAVSNTDAFDLCFFVDDAG